MKVNYSKEMAKTAIALIMMTCCLSLNGQWREKMKVVSSNRNANDWYGYAVDIHDEYAIVGAPLQDADISNPNAGAAYILRWNESQEWEEVQELVPTSREAFSYFGDAAAIFDDIAVVGAYSKDDGSLFSVGTVYVFERDEVTGNWIETQQLLASDRQSIDLFGRAIAISESYIAVGAHNVGNSAGAVYVFEKDMSGNWIHSPRLVASDATSGDNFGSSLAISGDQIIIGSPKKHEVSLEDVGSVYVFEKDETETWTQVQKLVASDRSSDDRFGISVAASNENIVVGAFLEDHDENGAYTRSDAGSAYVFGLDNSNNWIEVAKIAASDRSDEDNFGRSVGISEDYIVVGANLEDHDLTGNNASNTSGSAYIFKNEGNNNWNEVQKIVASDRDEDDNFGFSVAISSTHIIVGSYKEDHDASGVNSIADGGSVYNFQYKNPQTIAFNAIDSKLYGNTFELTQTSEEGLDIVYNSSDESVATISGNTVTTTGTGTTTIKASQPGNEFYWEAEDVSQTLTVDKTELTVSAENKTKFYGDQNPQFTIRYSGFVNGESEEDLTTEPTVDSEVEVTSDAGTYPIQTIGGRSDNYYFSHVPGTITVTKAPLTVTADDKEKTYGDQNPPLTYSYLGFANGETESDLSQIPDITTDAAQNSESGDYTINISGGKSENYDFTRVSGNLKVNKAILTAKANDYTIIEGEDLPTSLGISYTGFVLNEDVNVIDTPPTASLELENSLTPGVYDIKVSEGQDNNYDFKYENGTLTINKVLSALKENETTVYPNPSSDFIKIGNTKVDVVIIYDLNGIEVLVGHSQTMNISSLRAGTYLLKMKDAGGNILSTNRIVKK